MRIWGIQSGIREADEQIQSLGQEFAGEFEFKSAALKPLWQHVTSLLGYSPDSFFEYGADQLIAPWPNVIINGHPSTASIALAIKKRTQNKSFLVNIHTPGIPLHNFDLVIAPEHEKLHGANVLTITGHLNNINPEKLKKQRYTSPFDQIAHPQVLVLGGNASQSVILNDEEIIAIANDLNQFQRKIGGTLVITKMADPDHHLTSRLEAMEGVSIFSLDPKDSLINAFSFADVIVCLGDEITNLSMACSTGKPVLHYKLNHTSPLGFAELYQKLLSMNMIATIHDNLQKVSYHPLREAERVAGHICQLLHKKHKVNVLL